MVTAGPYKSVDLPGVNFYSPIGVASGLGSAGRGYLAALRAAGVPVSLVPVHELLVHQPSVGAQNAGSGHVSQSRLSTSTPIPFIAFYTTTHEPLRARDTK
jgi:hypothetical protein